MPSIEHNQFLWNQHYDWSQAGEEWSAGWGDSKTQWEGSLLPRIKSFVPTGTILEIAPGFGRWTQFLKDLCDNLLVVDLSAKCLDACRARFATDTHIRYHLNDGKSLAMIPDASVDFVFSFDSLVHAEAEVLEAYVQQLARKLKPQGVGFIHHSNLGAYPAGRYVRKMLPRGKRWIERLGLLESDAMRATSMTARRFVEYAEAAGLQCIGQEIVNWGKGRRLIDCFSLFAPQQSKWTRPNRILKNPAFMQEARVVQQRAQQYNLAS